MAYLLFIIFQLFFLIVLITVLISVFRGAPFLPTKNESVRQMVSLAKVRSGEKAADLGSGDGRIVIELAKAGAEAHGFEINLLLVLWSRWKIFRAGLSGKAFIHWKDFWLESLNRYDLITIYGITYIMPKLEKKLQKELKKNSRVVSYIFKFPTWPCSSAKNNVYLYRKKSSSP